MSPSFEVKQLPKMTLRGRVDLRFFGIMALHIFRSSRSLLTIDTMLSKVISVEMPCRVDWIVRPCPDIAAWRFTMKRIGFVAIGLLLLCRAADAQPTWSAISFSTTPPNAPLVLAAADALMSSAAGKEFPGKLLLQIEVADGSDPATHSFIPIYKTSAERAAFVEKLQADPAWGIFQGEMAKLSQPVSTVLYRTVKTWGELVDTDHVWMGHAFQVEDPKAFVAALDKFIASPTGKKFPGQAYLSAVVAGGITPVTHLISVGYASEAEMESWIATRDASADWATYLTTSRKAATYLGGNLSRDLKSWGPATLSGLAGR
jgi:hypothetical protein